LKGINMLLTVNAFVSLDGTIQGPAGPEEYDRSFPAERGGWLVPFADQLGGVVDTDWFALADAILLGRTTYQIMQPHWSQVTDPDDPVATVLNTYPKYVVSSTLTPEAATWANTELISDKVFERVAELKQAAGRELQVHGSLKLAKSLHPGRSGRFVPPPGLSGCRWCWETAIRRGNHPHDVQGEEPEAQRQPDSAGIGAERLRRRRGAGRRG
jgi:dihydrofolate reductase